MLRRYACGLDVILRLIFVIFFLQFELSYFFAHFHNESEWDGYRVPCVRNSSNSFIPILLKLYRCCDHASKICMWFGYNPQINFCHFFHNLNLVMFSGILVNG